MIDYIYISIIISIIINNRYEQIYFSKLGIDIALNHEDWGLIAFHLFHLCMRYCDGPRLALGKNIRCSRNMFVVSLLFWIFCAQTQTLNKARSLGSESQRLILFTWFLQQQCLQFYDVTWHKQTFLLIKVPWHPSQDAPWTQLGSRAFLIGMLQLIVLQTNLRQIVNDQTLNSCSACGIPIGGPDWWLQWRSS